MSYDHTNAVTFIRNAMPHLTETQAEILVWKIVVDDFEGMVGITNEDIFNGNVNLKEAYEQYKLWKTLRT
jgi:hypothetical protein